MMESGRVRKRVRLITRHIIPATYAVHLGGKRVTLAEFTSLVQTHP